MEPSANGGVHCETSALGVLLRHQGITLSEPMLFGLGCGLSFIYWDSKQQTLPFVGGRTKPFEVITTLSRRLGLTLSVAETSSPKKAWEQVAEPVRRGTPVGLQLDSYHLDYFTSRVHFAGHMAALIGYDDTTAYLIDTAQQGGSVSTSLESLARARAERGPMAARHRSFTIDEGIARPITPSIVLGAIVDSADAFLTPPIANLGCRGITTLSRKMPSWPTRISDPSTGLPTIALLMERGGTGGGLFRNLYRDFLLEAQAVCIDALTPAQSGALQAGIAGYTRAATLWSSAASLIEQGAVDPTRLVEASSFVATIAAVETEAMTSLRSLGPNPTSDGSEAGETLG